MYLLWYVQMHLLMRFVELLVQLVKQLPSYLRLDVYVVQYG